MLIASRIMQTLWGQFTQFSLEFTNRMASDWSENDERL